MGEIPKFRLIIKWSIFCLYCGYGNQSFFLGEMVEIFILTWEVQMNNNTFPNTYDPIMHSMFISMCEQTTISWLLTIEYTSRSDIAFPQLTGEIFSRQFTCSIFCLNTNTTKWGRIEVLFTIYLTLVDFLINPKIHHKINNY